MPDETVQLKSSEKFCVTAYVYWGELQLQSSVWLCRLHFLNLADLVFQLSLSRQQLRADLFAFLRAHSNETKFRDIISFFLAFKHDFIRCVDFSRIAASNTASDDVTH